MYNVLGRDLISPQGVICFQKFDGEFSENIVLLISSCYP